jgi:hypothetical protein
METETATFRDLVIIFGSFLALFGLAVWMLLVATEQPSMDPWAPAPVTIGEHQDGYMRTGGQ